MQLPDKLLLSKIETQNAYCDWGSFETFTEIEKKKYKLAGNILQQLGIYTFFVLTSNKDSCQRFLTIEISYNDWQDREAGHLTLPFSYIDIKKGEVMEKKDLLRKMRDSKNGFLFVGRLSDKKYKQLQELRNKVPKSKKPVSSNIKNFIDLALAEAEADIVGKKLKDLGLN